jgi:hypothetical protein
MLHKNFTRQEAAFATLIANYDGYKRVLPTATLTLTQSGLLAALLERQRSKVSKVVWRRARRGHMRAGFWRTLAWLFHPHRVKTRAHDSAKPLMGTVPRHT